MSNESMEEELVMASMQIIMNAGNARNTLAEALKEAKKFNFDLAEEKLQEARESTTTAHKSQTEIIQGEASGNKYPHSLLFTHAQDHLMTMNSEMNFATELIDVLKIIQEKL